MKKIDNLVTLDIRPDSFFFENGYDDQHSGGDAFSFDKDVMSWLFKERL